MQGVQVLIPSWGAKISYTSGLNKNKIKNRCNIVTYSIIGTYKKLTKYKEEYRQVSHLEKFQAIYIDNAPSKR